MLQKQSLHTFPTVTTLSDQTVRCVYASTVAAPFQRFLSWSPTASTRELQDSNSLTCESQKFHLVWKAPSLVLVFKTQYALLNTIDT